MNLELDDLLKTISFLGTSIAGLISWLIVNPSREETRINYLRKNIRSYVRVKLAYEIAKILPIKTEQINHDDFYQQCREEVDKYLDSNSDLLISYYDCNKLSSSCISYLRIFKYVVIISPIIGLLMVLLPFAFINHVLDSNYYILITSLLVIVIIGCAVIMERKKDKFNDLGTKFEVIYEEKK